LHQGEDLHFFRARNIPRASIVQQMQRAAACCQANCMHPIDDAHHVLHALSYTDFL
jgi:hypothetical protein